MDFELLGLLGWPLASKGLLCWILASGLMVVSWRFLYGFGFLGPRALGPVGEDFNFLG